MSPMKPRSVTASIVGVLMLAAFLVPLQHAGPHGIPGRGLVGGPLCFVISDLRLWIVDHEGSEWVSMPLFEAEENAIDGAKLELLHAGTTRCVVPRIVDDPMANRWTFDLRQEK